MSHRAHAGGASAARCSRSRRAGAPLAGALKVYLSVTEPAANARRLYEAAGFRSWGRKTRALQWEGQSVDEIHLVLDLAAPGS